MAKHRRSRVGWAVRVVFLTLVAMAIPGATALAQTGSNSSLGFAVSPPTTELQAEPGQTVRGGMKLINLTDLPISLGIERKSFVARGDEGQVDLVEDNPLYTLAPWFTAGSNSIDVAARGTAQLDFSIAVPPNAEPGGRYGALVFATRQTKLPSGQSGAAVKQELAGLIFLRIAGEAREQLAIDSFRSGRGLYESGPVGFEAHIRNLGNVHAKPNARITIKNLLGIRVASFNLEAKNVLPESVRRLQGEWTKRALFGRYRAELTLDNGGKQTLVAAASFTVMPYRLLALIGLLILLLYWTVWRRRRRFGRAVKVLFGRD